MQKTNLKNPLASSSYQGYYMPTKRICPFCKRGIGQIDHKDVEMIKRYTSIFGRINSARRTKACAIHQRLLAKAIKRARHLALLPFTN